MVAHYLHHLPSGSYTRAKRRQNGRNKRDRFHKKKPTNQDNPIMFDDTPVKANEDFEDVVEHLDDLISLD